VSGAGCRPVNRLIARDRCAASTWCAKPTASAAPVIKWRSP